MSGKTKLSEVFNKNKKELLADWEKEQKNTLRPNLIKNSDLHDQSQEFMDLFGNALEKGNLENILSSEWSQVRDFLTSLSHSRGVQGFTPSETATFVFFT